MAKTIISGNLENFPIENILQTISQDKKEGILYLDYSDDEKVEIHFKNGDIVFVRYKGKYFENLNFIKNYLLYKKKFPKRVIEEIEEFSKSYDSTFEEILFTGNYLERDEVIILIRRFYEDLLCEILMRNYGTYRFDIGVEIKSFEHIRISTDFILMEAARRSDTKKILNTMFSNRKLVFELKNREEVILKKIKKSSDDSESDKEKDENIDVDTIIAETDGVNIYRDVILQINGFNNVDEIIKFSGWSEYRVLEILRELLEEDYLNVVGEKDIEDRTLEDEIVYSLKERTIFILYTTVFLVLFSLLTLLRLFDIKITLFNMDYNSFFLAKQLNKNVKEFYEDQFEYAFKIFYIKKLKYPKKFSDIEKENILDKKQLKVKKVWKKEKKY